MQELDAGQISPRAEIVLHMDLEGDYAEKTAGRIDQICGHAIFPKIVMIICLSGWRKEVLIRAWNCKKNAGEKCWELYYYGDESKEEQNLKKQLQEIADQNKLVWKTE